MGLAKRPFSQLWAEPWPRGLETKIMVDYLKTSFDELVANIKAGDSKVFERTNGILPPGPSRAKGVGFTEAPRGALAHYVKIENGKVSLYQAVVPTTWNAAPEDKHGQKGPYEAALIGTPMADPNKPLEILRIIHSFDPCIACAAHIIDVKPAENP